MNWHHTIGPPFLALSPAPACLFGMPSVFVVTAVAVAAVPIWIIRTVDVNIVPNKEFASFCFVRKQSNCSLHILDEIVVCDWS